MQERAYIVQTPVHDTSLCDQRLEAALHWHMGKHVTKRHQQSSWSMEKAVACKHEGKITSLWISAKLKPALFRANTLHNWLFSEPPTVYRGKHVVSRHFYYSYLKENKCVSRTDTNPPFAFDISTFFRPSGAANPQKGRKHIRNQSTPACKIWRESTRGLSRNRWQKSKQKTYGKTNTSPFALTSEWQVIK